MSERASLLRGGLWAMGGYAASQGLRFAANLVLARILAPDALGVLFIVNTIRVGVELLTDLGIEQSIVHNERGLQPAFLRTAWTVQVLRGEAIAVLSAALAWPLGRFYGIDPLILAVMSLAPLFNSLASVGIFVAVRRMEVRRRTLFEVSADLAGFAITVALALALRNVWALVLGALAQVLVRALLSYRLGGVRMGLALDPRALRSILHFGKWIFLASALTYAAANIDRLVLARQFPVALIGVFGLARTIADLPSMLAGRLGYQLLMPAFAAWRDRRDAGELAHFLRLRGRFLLVAGLGLAGLAGLADVAVGVLYDARYHAAGWMLAMLLLGSWFTLPASLNEATLVGLGHPLRIGRANAAKFVVLVAALPLVAARWGLAAALLAMVAAEVLRFAVLAHEMPRDLRLARQDLALCALVAGLMAAIALVRAALGFAPVWQGAFA